jgi:uncharacterized protein YkwD
MKSELNWIFVLMVLTLLVGCREDGDGGSQGYCAVTDGWDAAYVAKEREVVAIVNAHRAAGADCGAEGTFGPAPALTVNEGLECAARVHSKDMSDRGFFEHDTPEGDGPDDRMAAAGVDVRSWGENIAAGSSTAEGAMTQWMNSDGHCANFMNPRFSHIGIGYYPGGEWGNYWTATLMASPQ